MAYDQIVAQGLGLESNEKMIGFLYVGQIKGNQKALPEHDPEHFVTRW